MKTEYFLVYLVKRCLQTTVEHIIQSFTFVWLLKSPPPLLSPHFSQDPDNIFPSGSKGVFTLLTHSCSPSLWGLCSADRSLLPCSLQLISLSCWGVVPRLVQMWCCTVCCTKCTAPQPPPDTALPDLYSVTLPPPQYLLTAHTALDIMERSNWNKFESGWQVGCKNKATLLLIPTKSQWMVSLKVVDS